MGLTYEMLQGNHFLEMLKNEYLKSRTEPTILSFLSVLNISKVYVPFHTYTTQNDRIKMCQYKGEPLDADDYIRLRPVVAGTGSGKQLLPLFLQKEQVPEKYEDQMSLVEIEAPMCLRIAHAMPDVEGILIDMFSEKAQLPLQIADMMLKLPSPIQE